MRRRVVFGVLAPVVGGFYQGGIIAGLTRAAATVGGTVVAMQTLPPGLHRSEVLATSDFAAPVGMDHIDGYLCLPAAVRVGYLRRLRAAGKPVVLVSDTVEGFEAPVVASDNAGGVRAAVAHLVAHGHERIAFVGNLTQLDMNERYQGYLAALREHGIAVDPALFIEAPDNMDGGGRAAAGMLLAQGLPATAVLAATDLNAVGIMEVFERAGVRVPTDVAVVGFDNADIALTTRSRLSSVSQQIEDLGEHAGRLLIAALAGTTVPAELHRTPATLVIRQSCGCGAGGPSTPDAVVPGGLAAALGAALLGMASTGTDRVDLDHHVGRLVDLLAAAVAGRDVDSADLHDAAAGLWRLNRRRTDLAALVAIINRCAPSGPAVSAVVLQFCVALAETVVGTRRAELDQARAVLTAQYHVDMDLLGRGERDPRELGWIPRSSSAVAACLGVWNGPATPDGDRPLRLVGARDDIAGPAVHGDCGPTGSGRMRTGRTGTGRAAGVGRLLGSTTSLRQFPPVELLHLADAAAGLVVYATPVQLEPSDRGFFAAVAPIQADGTGRDRFNHWAALLAMALDQEELLASLRRQRENLAYSYERERDLVETVRASEERYALAARAANDGLWDWDVGRGTVYYSTRWKAMIGLAEDAVGDSPDEWLSRVHSDDRAKLDDAIAGQLDGSLGTLEYQHRLRTADGSYRWMLCRAQAVRDSSGRATRIVGFLTDVTDRTELEEQLRHRALYDNVTGLPNRSFFHDVLAASIARARRHADHRFAVAFLDLDGFKVVNDSLGHAAGDRLLAGVAQRLRGCVRATDTAARLGGDEFAVHLDGAGPDDVPRIVTHIQDALRAPFRMDGHEVVVTSSIGVALSGTGYDAAVDVLRDADIAMYRAKGRERGSYAVFDLDMRDGAVERMRIEVDLRAALDTGQLRLHYQPIVDLGTGRLVALEALVRWDHPSRGMINPGEFLPVAEETGLIVPIGHWVVEQVCRDINRWQQLDASFAAHGPAVSINVSNREFWHGALLPHITGTLVATGVSARSIAVEITEGVIMHNPELALRTLQQFREHDLALHIDDFGTGYSSLGSLRRFPIQAMKIDRSFVAALGSDDKDEELVNTILALGRNLGVEVIAEGVETSEQAALLRRLGCHHVQGYYYSRPVPSEAVPALIGRQLPMVAGGRLRAA